MIKEMLNNLTMYRVNTSPEEVQINHGIEERSNLDLRVMIEEMKKYSSTDGIARGHIYEWHVLTDPWVSLSLLLSMEDITPLFTQGQEIKPYLSLNGIVTKYGILIPAKGEMERLYTKYKVVPEHDERTRVEPTDSQAHGVGREVVHSPVEGRTGLW